MGHRDLPLAVPLAAGDDLEERRRSAALSSWTMRPAASNGGAQGWLGLSVSVKLAGG
ncbi:MAG: hypothetical protein JO188_00375 [Hyphomicrobiales bacterium]|nr:hypothetical protein [Hyphomicrobiales bacterium]